MISYSSEALLIACSFHEFKTGLSFNKLDLFGKGLQFVDGERLNRNHCFKPQFFHLDPLRPKLFNPLQILKALSGMN